MLEYSYAIHLLPHDLFTESVIREMTRLAERACSGFDQYSITWGASFFRRPSTTSPSTTRTSPRPSPATPSASAYVS